MRKLVAALIIVAGACAVLYAADPGRAAPDMPGACSADNRTQAGCILLSLGPAEYDHSRPQIVFDHERHVRELGERACADCHAKKTDGTLVFEFPKNTADTAAPDSLTKAWHDSCIGCHAERSNWGQDAGPVTCGECHARDRHSAFVYAPVLPSYYDPLRDTYHGECRNCHKKPALTAENAGELDWKKFYVHKGEVTEPQQPPSGFDYHRHDLHSRTLKDDCGLCHYLSPEKRRALDHAEKKPQCSDWLLEPDPQGIWREEDYAHSRCVNCHFTRKAAGEEKAGPLLCSGCHTHDARTPEQMKDAARSGCEQKEKILITSDNATVLAAVPFDHAAHQLRTTSCQECHHKNMQACRECHTPTGDEKGEFVTLAQAYHREQVNRSCVGCHAEQKQKGECAGCHQQLPSTLESKSACTACHSGSLEALQRKRATVPPESLMPPGTKDSLHIGKLGQDYEKVDFKHLQIAKALAAASEKSLLAGHFHTDGMAMCAACHHYSPLEKGKPVPACRTCHDKKDILAAGRPDLLGAYHQQCLGCHQKMGGTEEKMPQTCEGCHARTGT